MKIAMIDDDTDFITATRSLLEANRYSVVAANTTREGYAMLLREKPDLLLLDVMLAHDTEGFQFAGRLKQDQATSHIPVIILTGISQAKGLPFSFEPDEDWLLVNAVLEKPLKPDQLLQTIKQALLPQPAAEA